MTSFWQNVLVRCTIAGLCGAAYTAVAISQSWFSSGPEDLGEHVGHIVGAAVMAVVAAGMIFGLEYVLTPDLSTVPLDDLPVDDEDDAATRAGE